MKPTVEYKERGGSWTQLDWRVWSQIKDNNYTAPKGTWFRFTWTEPASFLLARRSDKFKVVVLCKLRLNRFENYQVKMFGVDHRDTISMTDITTGIWLTMFEDFEYNPLLPLIKPPAVITNQQWKWGSFAPRLKPAEFEIDDFKKTSINEVNKVLQAVEYLHFVDFFNGRNPLRQMAVKGIYNRYVDYLGFWNAWESESDRAKGSIDSLRSQVKDQTQRLKTPLARNPYLDRSKRGGKKVGGRLTDEGVQILFDWVSKTNQPLELLDSVRYEA